MERVSTEDPLSDLWRILVGPLQEVDERVAVVAVEAVRALLPGHRHLLHVLRCMCDDDETELPIDKPCKVNYCTILQGILA